MKDERTVFQMASGQSQVVEHDKGSTKIEEESKQGDGEEMKMSQDLSVNFRLNGEDQIRDELKEKINRTQMAASFAQLYHQGMRESQFNQQQDFFLSLEEDRRYHHIQSPTSSSEEGCGGLDGISNVSLMRSLIGKSGVVPQERINGASDHLANVFSHSSFDPSHIGSNNLHIDPNDSALLEVAESVHKLLLSLKGDTNEANEEGRSDTQGHQSQRWGDEGNAKQKGHNLMAAAGKSMKDNIMLELERFFQSDKNLCLSLATLISRQNDQGRPIGIQRKNPAANFQILVTDDFKLQASAILLQRVSAEFLLTAQGSTATTTAGPSQKIMPVQQQQIANSSSDGCGLSMGKHDQPTITQQGMAEAEFFVKCVIQALESTDDTGFRNNLIQLLSNILLLPTQVSLNQGSLLKQETPLQGSLIQLGSQESPQDHEERKVELSDGQIASIEDQNAMPANDKEIERRQSSSESDSSGKIKSCKISSQISRPASKNSYTSIISNRGTSSSVAQTIMKTTMSLIICELYSQNERKTERLLSALAQMFDCGSKQSKLIGENSPTITTTQGQAFLLTQRIQNSHEFLLEYLMSSLTFILLNRRSPGISKYSLELLQSIIDGASQMPSVRSQQTNILEVIFKIIAPLDSRLELRSVLNGTQLQVTSPQIREEIRLEAIRCITLLFDKDPFMVIRAYENGQDFSVIIESVKDADPEISLSAIQFWQNFIMLDTVVYKDDFKKKLFDQLLPLLLEQCKMKSEDYEKFLKDKLDAEVLEKKKQISKGTIRSKAAKTIERISEKFQKEVFFAMRPQLERYLNSKLSWEEKEAAILVLGVISGFNHEFKAIEPQLKQLVPFLLDELKTGVNSQLKATICWTLSSFTEWMLLQGTLAPQHPEYEAGAKLLIEYISKIVELFDDIDKGVQKSAFSNFQMLLNHQQCISKIQPHLPRITITIVKAFKSADQYTTMSLYDVIFQICQRFPREQLGDLAIQVMPNLIESFRVTNDEQSNSIFSLIDCIQVVMNVLGSRVEQFAHALISRAIEIVIPILSLSTEEADVEEQQEKVIKNTKVEVSESEEELGQKLTGKNLNHPEESKVDQPKDDSGNDFFSQFRREGKITGDCQGTLIDAPLPHSLALDINSAHQDDLSQLQSKVKKLEQHEDNKTEVARKTIELVHNVFRNVISGVSADMKTSYKSLLGVPQLRYSEQLQRKIFEQTQIIDFFLICFKCQSIQIVHDAMANFSEILPDVPIQIIESRGAELLRLILQKLQDQVKSPSFSNLEVPEQNSTEAAEKPQMYDQNSILICNNACWALGEIAMKSPEQIKPIFKDVINSLADLLNSNILSDLQSSQNSDQILKHFTKTISITLGRLGKLDPQSAAYCLPRIIKPWCLALRYISGSEEKVQAFRGLCAMIPYNPIGIADSFPYFCEALVEFKNPTQELEYIFQNLIVTFKQCLGVVEWNAYLESFPPQLKKELNTRFRQ